MQAQFLSWSIVAARLAGCIAAVLLATSLAALPARAADPAEAYVQERANEVMEIINNSSYSVAKKKAEVSDIIDGFIDVDGIAMFTLGKYRSLGNDDYVAAFRDYLINYYVGQLSQFDHLTLTVTGSEDLGSQGTIVTSTGQTDGPDPVEINWRVAGGSSIVDVEIEGVWMAQTLREQVVAALDQNGGQISAAIDLLHELASGE